jgi:leader peptidase (prepilin peptidase)/N-methyltransferase
MAGYGSLWTPWPFDGRIVLAAIVLFALLTAAVLGRLAAVLPRTILDLPETAAHGHDKARAWGLVVCAPVVAMGWHLALGPVPAAWAATLFTLVLIALAWIDWQTGLLPDLLTLSLLWAGLLVNVGGGFSPLADAVTGAAAGYLLLWACCRAMAVFTGRVGMGNGDFKLLAALGAWLGWTALPGLLLVSSLTALAVGLVLRISGRLGAHEGFSFGPYLALAGLVMMARV